jgi:hypothetical protein
MTRISYGKAVALQMLQAALKGDASARREIIRLQVLQAERLELEREIVIHARPVFDEEEISRAERERRGIEEKHWLFARKEKLESLLAANGLAHLLTELDASEAKPKLP